MNSYIAVTVCPKAGELPKLVQPVPVVEQAVVVVTFQPRVLQTLAILFN